MEKLEPRTIIYEKYEIQKVMKSSFYSTIMLAFDLEEKEEVVIKVEHVREIPIKDLPEASIYRMLNGGEGIPKVVESKNGIYENFMILEKLGPSLEQLFERCGHRFSLKTVLMLADQFLQRIKFVHENNFIHRDLTPANFVMGTGKKENTVFLIDFEFGKQFYFPKLRLHMPYKEENIPIGTVRFCTLNAHFGVELSRRDDLGSLGYILVYFAKGRLPWQNIKAKSSDALHAAVMNRKHKTTLSELCHGLPAEFQKYFKYCNQLSFEEKPDYDQLCKMFRAIAKRSKILYDNRWDWVLAAERTKTQDDRKDQLEAR